ncbi:MAG: NADH-quinone oxidoreductase subunit M [Pseudomonadota bacterium]
MLNQHLLSLIIFLPLVGAVVLALIPGKFRTQIRWVTLTFSLITLVLCAFMFACVRGSGEFELIESLPWIPSLNIYYRVGVDGASMLLVFLAALLSMVSIIVSRREITKRVKLFHILLLVTETGLLGVFCAIDMFLFYVFWDAALIPICFIIGIWGSGDRLRIAMKFLIFTMTGSVIMLVALLYVAAATSSFNLIDWYAHTFAPTEQLWLFAGFAIAFAIKAPLIGFHSWLPDAHTEAPTAGSVLLAGVLLKMGTYGFFRFAIPLFPQAMKTLSPLLLTLAVAGIIIGALLAMVQIDLKRLIAYSSISHMGFVLLGLFAVERYAATGAVLQMVNHGIITGGLFIMAGFLYERRRTRLIADYGGSARSFPILAVFFMLMALASLGLPGLSGFAGEFILLLGSFQTKTSYTAVAIIGVVLTAVYLIWVIQRVFFGPLKHDEERKMSDMRAREIACMLPLVIIVVLIGVWPKLALEKIWRPADAFVSLAKRGQLIVPVEPGANEIPNSKSQIPDKYQIPMTE